MRKLILNITQEEAESIVNGETFTCHDEVTVPPSDKEQRVEFEVSITYDESNGMGY